MDAVQNKNLKVLIVDDEVDLAQIIQEMVHRLGYTAQVAGNANEALEILKREHFDMIFTDLHMPGENGVALAQKIRQGPRTISKIVAITGDNFTPEFQFGEFFRYIDGRLIKPFTSRQIKEILNSFQLSQDLLQRQSHRHRVFMDGAIAVGQEKIPGKIIYLGIHGGFFHSDRSNLFPAEGEAVKLLIPANSLLKNNLDIAGTCSWVRKGLEGPWPSGIGIKFQHPVAELNHLKTDHFSVIKTA